MNRYNLTMKILVNVAVDASSPRVAKQAIKEELEKHDVLADMPGFVIENAEITGIFDVNHNEIESNDSSEEPL